jgi:hypothetical protein
MYDFIEWKNISLGDLFIMANKNKDQFTKRVN